VSCVCVREREFESESACGREGARGREFEREGGNERESARARSLYSSTACVYLYGDTSCSCVCVRV
jgi:hypothetical protein